LILLWCTAAIFLVRSPSSRDIAASRQFLKIDRVAISREERLELRIWLQYTIIESKVTMAMIFFDFQSDINEACIGFAHIEVIWGFLGANPMHSLISD
jgi:hypothetical protein